VSDSFLDKRARMNSLSIVGSIFLNSSPTDGICVSPRARQILLHLRLHLPAYCDNMLPLYCQLPAAITNLYGDHAAARATVGSYEKAQLRRPHGVGRVEQASNISL
jgi:hypothetical protein